MERYRNFVRLEQMKEHIRAGRNEEALKLAEQLDPAKIKSSSDLSILSDLYLESGMLAKAGDCLAEQYSRKKTRSILMQLINLSVRIKKVEEAEKYYREFKAMAPDDFYNYIFRYSIDKIKGRNYETLIESLEKLKETEYIDSWAYELAKLYHKAGRKDDCIRECDDIVTWFGDGEYVDRAKALKAYYLGELNGMMSRESAAKQKTAEEESTYSAKTGDIERNAGNEEKTDDLGTAASDDQGIVEIIGTVEEVAVAAGREDLDMKVVRGADEEASAVGVKEENAEDRRSPEEGRYPKDSRYQEDGRYPEDGEDDEDDEIENGSEIDPDDDDLSDYEEDLREFENEFNIKLADEVMAQIEGLDENRFEVEPVDISGVLNDEEYADKAAAGTGAADGSAASYEPAGGAYEKSVPEPEVIEEEYTAEDLVEAESGEEVVGEEAAEAAVTEEAAENEDTAETEEITGYGHAAEAEVIAEIGDAAETGAIEEAEDAVEAEEITEVEETAETEAIAEIKDAAEAEATAEAKENAETGGSFEAVAREQAEITGSSAKTESIREAAGKVPASVSGRAVTGAELEAALEAELEEALAAQAEEEAENLKIQTAARDEEVLADEEEDRASEPTEDDPEPEIITHSFKAFNNVKIAQDSLLATFLRNNGAELEDYFGFFAYQADTRGQLIKTIEILLNPQIKNKCVVVSGGKNSGSKAIIKGLTKVLKESGFLKNPQIAFTEAEKINTMSLKAQVDRLIGCCLMINHAGRLSSDSVRQLLDANEKFTGKTAVVMSDQRSEISRLLKENRELNSMFPLRIHIPVYDAEDMEDLLFVKLNEKEYSIEKSAFEAMQKELRRIVREVGEGSLAEADRYIETVIDRLETRNAKKLLTGGFKGVSEKDRIIFLEDTRI